MSGGVERELPRLETTKTISFGSRREGPPGLFARCLSIRLPGLCPRGGFGLPRTLTVA